MGVNLYNEENGFVLSFGINLGAIREKIASITYYKEVGTEPLKVISREKEIYLKESRTNFYRSIGIDLNVEAPITERFKIQCRNNFYVYKNDDSILIEGGNFNSMLGISYKII